MKQKIEKVNPIEVTDVENDFNLQENLIVPNLPDTSDFENFIIIDTKEDTKEKFKIKSIWVWIINSITSINKGKLISCLIIFLLFIPLFITFLNPSYFLGTIKGVRSDTTEQPQFLAPVFNNLSAFLNPPKNNRSLGVPANYNPDLEAGANNGKKPEKNLGTVFEAIPRPAISNQPLLIKVRVTNQGEEAISNTFLNLNYSYQLVTGSIGSRVKIVKIDPSLPEDIVITINYEMAKRLGLPAKDNVVNMFISE
jgi:hypothetical protein